MTNIIEVKNLNKSFDGKPAVINVSLNVNKGEIFGFLGPNGSGKTTTIRMLCGLMIPDSGEGQCLGFDILKDSAQIKNLVGYVPQSFSLYKDLTVEENLLFIARAYKETNYRQKVKDIIEELNLAPYKNIYSGKLSGGWKQRLSLAAAMIHSPKLLLLDEPTAGVDPKARREFWNYISYLTTKGISSLVSTHYMDEAERCNRLAYVVYGNLLAEGTIPEIIAHANLTSYVGRGNDFQKIYNQIQNEKGVLQVVPWGNEWRICGIDDDLLNQAMKKYSTIAWRRVDTTLEEVFIHLVSSNPKQAMYEV
jgi:ABC-2 type transport system ATP-binding protein